MKKILTILSISLLIISCGGNDNKSIEKTIEQGDLEALRAKRTEIVAKQQSVADQLKQIDQAIATLNTVKKLPLVTVIKAKDTVFNHYLELQGNVETKQNIVLYPEMSGILIRIYVDEGQKVRKGQLLARIDDGGLSKQLEQARSQMELSRITYNRQRNLWKQKIGSEIEYLRAKTDYTTKRKIVSQIKEQVQKSDIRAPFSGVIDDIITEQGSVVSAGQNPILRIVNLDNMYIETEVPERYISTISKGKDVAVYFPVLDKTINTKVRQVGNYINPNNRSFMVEVGIPSSAGTVKPNLTAKVKINDYTSEKAILIPQSIISENAEGDQYTYVTFDRDAQNIAMAKRVIIKTGKTQGGLIEVVEGIHNGDAIISEGARSVKDGQQVKILN